MKQTTNGKREFLERKANIARERVLRTLDAIDQKRHAVVDVGARVSELGRRYALPVGAAIGASWVAVGMLAYALHRRRMRMLKRSPRYWLTRATQPPKPSFVLDTLKRVLAATLVAATSELARRMVRHGLSRFELRA